jgi:hypothetical protein
VRLALFAGVVLGLVLLLYATTDYGKAAEACFPHRVMWIDSDHDRVYCGITGWRDF